MREGINIRFLRRATWACVMIIVMVAAGVVALSLLWFPRDGRPEPPNTAAPRLETHPQLDLRHYQHAKQQLLHSYAWVDARHNIARIPLDQAMQALATQAHRSSREQP